MKHLGPLPYFIVLSFFLGLNISASAEIKDKTNQVYTSLERNISSLHIEHSKALPSVFMQLDDFFAHHILVAEKSTHLLHLYQNNEGRPQYIKSYQMASGKTQGNKYTQGDLKTPEGIYSTLSFITEKELLKRYGNEGKKYGAGAFVLNYPNPVDRLDRKTGGGIWLHSTDNNGRVVKGLDSRGCLVLTGHDLKDVSQYIELEKTTVIIVQNLTFYGHNTWKVTKKALQETVDNWLKAWQTEDTGKYISYYSPQYRDNFRKNYSQFKAYKKTVFSRPGAPKITLSNINIFHHEGTAVVHMIQHYESPSINDKGHKTLYLRRNKNYQWKIVNEKWKRLENDIEIAFTPSMRFFQKEERPN